MEVFCTVRRKGIPRSRYAATVSLIVEPAGKTGDSGAIAMDGRREGKQWRRGGTGRSDLRGEGGVRKNCGQARILLLAAQRDHDSEAGKWLAPLE